MFNASIRWRVQRAAIFALGCASVMPLVFTQAAGAGQSQLANADPRTFRLISADLKDGASLPEAHVNDGFGRQGKNLSPHLKWEEAPEGTKSFVITVYDPDAPTGSGWWHWVVINIPASVNELARGAGSGGKLPHGALQTRTDFGRPGFGGAAPPPGETHRYIFTVHALKVDQLPVDAEASAAMVGFMVHAHSLGKASLTVTYGP